MLYRMRSSETGRRGRTGRLGEKLSPNGGNSGRGRKRLRERQPPVAGDCECQAFAIWDEPFAG